MNRKLTVSLVTYNGAAFLPQCLASIAHQTFRDFNLIVFDNNSSDDTVSIVRQQYPLAQIIENSRNIGFAAGHNRAIAQTQSEIVCILNQDVALEQTYFELCTHAFDADPTIGSLCGVLFRVSALTDGFLFDILDSCGIGMRKNHAAFTLGEGLMRDRFSVPLQPFGVPATAALYRRSALDDCALRRADGRIEYFDEDFFMYKEDVDLSYRLAWRGWHARCVDQARGIHVRTARIGRRRTAHPLLNRLSLRNHFFMLIKNVSAGTWMRYGFAILLYECAKFFYVCIREPWNLSIFVDCFRKIPQMFFKRAAIMKNRRISDEDMARFFSSKNI